MKKSGGTGKTKGKTKAVKPVRHKEDTGGHGRTKRGSNPIAILVILPLVLGIGGFLGWYYHQHGHLPLFVTEEQRQKTIENAISTWDKIQQTTLDKWKTTKEELAKLDKRFATEYEEYLKNRDKKRRETEFLLQDTPAPVAAPVRQTPVRIAPTPMPAPVTAAPAPRPVQPVPTPSTGTPPVIPKPVTPPVHGGTTTPPTPVQPVQPGIDTATPAPTQPIDPPVTTLPVETPPAVPQYNPQEDTNYKAGVKKYDAAFAASEKADQAEGEAAIAQYTEAIQLVKAASASWQLVADKAQQEGVSSDPFVTSIANCEANAKVWQENIVALKKAAEAPPPTDTVDNTGGSAAMGSSGGFYGSHPKWAEGKKHFKEGYDIFTKNVGGNTGQDSRTLNKYIDQAVEKFNKAQETWEQAEADWMKKYPGNKGPKSDLDMMDKAMGEVQFYRYACMKMHTFER